MTDTNVTNDISVQLKRVFPYRAEVVFEAWSKPELLSQWFGCGPKNSATVLEFDFKVDGNYRITQDEPDGKPVHVATGKFREIIENERLVFTFDFEPPATQMGETLVTIEFNNVGGETELVLTHSLLPNEDARAGVEHGWCGGLNKLVAMSFS